MNAKTFQAASLSRLVHWGAALAVLAAGAFFFFVFFYSGLEKSVDVKSRAVDARIKETRAFMQSTRDMNKMLEELKIETQVLKAKTLQAGEHAKVISIVADATKSQNIVMTSFKPVFSELKEKAKTENKPLLPVFFELKMECTYKQLGSFLEALQDSPLLLSVTRYELASDKLKPGRISADITLSAYEERGYAV